VWVSASFNVFWRCLGRAPLRRFSSPRLGGLAHLAVRCQCAFSNRRSLFLLSPLLLGRTEKLQPAPYGAVSPNTHAPYPTTRSREPAVSSRPLARSKETMTKVSLACETPRTVGYSLELHF